MNECSGCAARERDIAELHDLLDEVQDFLDGQVDVVDGDYGQPKPNRAMQLVIEIERVRGGTL